MLGKAERGTTKLLTSRAKIPYGSAEPYLDTVRCLYHAPKGAYHEFRKEFYITAHSAYITRRKALYHVTLSLETNDTFTALYIVK